jgi:hypothetical protein
MTTILIIVALTSAVYIYAMVAFYYGFKNWHPMCGGSCSREKGAGLCAREAGKAKEG